MNLNNSRLKAIVVSSGLSFWFFIFSTALNVFQIEYFVSFLFAIFTVTQIFSKKLESGLKFVGVINTKIFLGLLFVVVFVIYGILFRFLRVDFLRLKKQNKTYWLEMKELKESRIFKQY